MKLISYNIRGLGGLAKKIEVKRLIQKQKPDLISIQETKMEVVDVNHSATIWGSFDCDFTFSTSIGRSGGLLTIWDNSVLSIQRKYTKENYLILEGEWGEGKHPVIIVNVYAPCDARRKQSL